MACVKTRDMGLIDVATRRRVSCSQTLAQRTRTIPKPTIPCLAQQNRFKGLGNCIFASPCGRTGSCAGRPRRKVGQTRTHRTLERRSRRLVGYRVRSRARKWAVSAFGNHRNRRVFCRTRVRNPRPARFHFERWSRGAGASSLRSRELEMSNEGVSPVLGPQLGQA
jgi:hypothetical protein